MSSIKEHIGNLLDEIEQMRKDGHVTEPDEYVAVKDIELSIYEARKAFERTKDISKRSHLRNLPTMFIGLLTSLRSYIRNYM